MVYSSRLSITCLPIFCWCENGNQGRCGPGLFCSRIGSDLDWLPFCLCHNPTRSRVASYFLAESSADSTLAWFCLSVFPGGTHSGRDTRAFGNRRKGRDGLKDDGIECGFCYSAFNCVLNSSRT